MRNILLHTDSYKHSHHLQLPPETQYVSSYIEARAAAGEAHRIVQFVGLQPFLRDYLARPITRADIEEAEELIVPHGLIFNREGWDYILNEHDGWLPVEITALPEGVVVPRGTPLVQLRNTDPNVPWLTSFLETAMLRSIWYPSTVATAGFVTKAIIYNALKRSSDDPEGQITFKLHDFGARGVSSSESAALGGMAHLINFEGTDTLEGIVAARNYYNADFMPGYSIPASEHSTMTAWGREGEATAYRNMLEQFDGGMFSIVSDSYDLMHAVKNIYCGTLKDQISDLNGTLVVRPDSGDPVATPLKVVQALWETFGGTVNSKGYRVLNDKVRVIQGDGMDQYKIAALLSSMLGAGFSIDNITFGMGGGLLQAHTRDDLRFAMKANAISDGKEWRDIFKDPAADPAKRSKAGRQAVIREDGAWKSVRAEEVPNEANHLRTVYRNGRIFDRQSFTSVRAKASESLREFHDRMFKQEETQAA